MDLSSVSDADVPVNIRSFVAADHDVFRRLNMAWIEQYFVMEEEDYRELDHPEKIISGGGAIFIAERGGEAIGCCALIRRDADCVELAKLAVTEKARGRHVGWLLGCAVVAEARRLGAKRIHLDSNTRLTPAISLYRKLGFTEIAAQPSAFQRVDIQMALSLE